MKQLTPQKAIAAHCRWCMNERTAKGCNSPTCSLYGYRPGGLLPKQKPPANPVLTPCKAIRQRCLQCVESQSDVRNCQMADCALNPYQMGHNPNRKGIGGNGNPEGLKAAREKKTNAESVKITASESGGDCG